MKIVRKMIQIPKDSDLFKMISDLEKSKPKSKPLWKCIEERVIEIDKEKWAELIFKEFVDRISVYYPEKKETLVKLWPLIVWRIIWGEPLKEDYIKDIEKILR